jgi:2-phospho-L-lactate guanylyltransferase
MTETRHSVEAIVPVRGLPAGKKRLAALLSVDQRNRLVRAMLSDVVETLRAAPAVDAISILSADAVAAREAERLGVDFLRQPEGVVGLNAGLAYAQEQVAGRSDALLIVPADLPLVTPGDVASLIAPLAPGPAVAIAPSRDNGTNGLFLRPPAAIAPAYGPESASLHQEAARRAGIAVHLVDEPRWRLDLDTPEDLGRLFEIAAEGSARHTLACLSQDDFPPLPQS